MKTSDKPQVLFYQKLGQLFYAIASSDKVVRKSEYDTLKFLVKTEWSSLDDYNDQFGEDAACQIEIVFDWFEYKQLDAGECFEIFSDYYKEHRYLVSEERTRLIWKTANAIANAFSGKNKSELIMLTKLRLLMQNEK